MMKPGWMLSHPGTLKKYPFSAETLDFLFLAELNYYTVPSSFKSVYKLPLVHNIFATIQPLFAGK